MKIKKIFLYLILLSFGFFTSCTDDEIVKSGGQGVGMCFTISSLGEKIVNTRTVDSDKALNDVYVLLFSEGATPQLTQLIQASSSDNELYYADVPDGTTDGSFYVAANVGSLLDKSLIGKSLAEVKEGVKANLKTAVVGTSDSFIIESPKFPPMISLEAIEYTGTSGNYGTITLQRTVAKVTVTDASGNAKYKIQGFNAGNAAKTGFLFPQSSLSTEVGNYAGSFNGSYSLDSMMCVPAANMKTAELYVYETSEAAMPFVIVKGTYNGVVGYHRLNIWDRGNGEKYYDMVRNYIYNISITNIYTTGYATAKEAIEHPASNRDINVDITVEDGVSRDIVSNGEYYLGVSNSECLFYYTGNVINEVVTTAVIGGKNLPQLQMSFKTLESNNDSVMQVVDMQSNNSGITYHELKATLPRAFVKGEIILRLGDLVRKIEVEKKSDIIAIGGMYELGDGYVYAKTSESSNSDKWISYTSNPNVTDVEDGMEEYHFGGGQMLYMILTHNLVTTENGSVSPAKTRNAMMTLAKANDEGHTKVLINQPQYDIFEGSGNTLVTKPYVGAFWRAGQTGERVIRMSTGSYDVASWDATVAVGSNWAGLALGGSADPNIYKAKPTLGTDPGFDATYKVENPKSYISSRLAPNGEIIFRIGLKNTIGALEHRYGLVVLNLYNSRGGRLESYRIFTRQGDASDYVYRKTDKGYNDWGTGVSTPRPLSRKISAFNLTDPESGKGNTDLTVAGEAAILVHNSMPLDYLDSSVKQFDRKEFTPFPTSAGYLYIWNISDQVIQEGKAPYYMRAFHPTNNKNIGGVNIWENNDPNDITAQYKTIPLIYNPKGDPCPYGYRYPSIGSVNQGTTTDTSAGVSELIQSILYDPEAPGRGTASDIMSKYTLWGYYADGFFDRLEVNYTRYSYILAPINSMVVYGGVDKIAEANGNQIGYIGQVVFNPFNLASVFFPAVGRFSFSLLNSGDRYFLSVSERDNTDGITQCYPMDLSASKNQFAILKSQGSGAQPRTVRCVRDETQWPSIGTEF